MQSPIVRIAISALMPAWTGKLARLSCFLAASFSLFIVAAIARRELGENTACPDGLKSVLFTATVLGFGLASPLLLLASMVAIYHEAIWWGLLWGLCAAAAFGQAALEKYVGQYQVTGAPLTITASRISISSTKSDHTD